MYLLTTWPYKTPDLVAPGAGTAPAHMRWHQLQLAKLHNSLGCFQTF